MRCRAAARPSPRPDTYVLTVAVIVLTTATSACRPPLAIARYAASATAVIEKFPDAAAALAASCRRSESYRLRRTGPPWYDGDSVRAACAGRDSALRDVARVNRALGNYFAALSALAGSKDAETAGRVDDLGDAVGGVGVVDPAQARAVTALAKFAASRTTAGYRRSKLRDAIAMQNANVQVVTAALHDVIERDFGAYLEGDDAAATRFYRSALTENEAGEPLAAILVRNDYDSRHAALGEEADAARALSRAVVTIGRGHQRLFDARDHLRANELLAAIVASARELEAAMAKINRAF